MAHNRMKQQADQGRSERQFAEGDQVFLRLQPYKQMGHQKGHVPPAVGQPPWAGLSQGVLDENILLLLSCKGSTNHCPVSAPDEVPTTI
jgi:hypothetical protein